MFNRDVSTLLSLTTLAAIGLTAAQPVHAQNATPIATTGYNVDVVFTGATSDAANTQPFDNTTYSSAADSVYCFTPAGLFIAPYTNYGLPANGLVTSANGNGNTYQLQGYTISNMMEETQAAPTKTLSLVTPGKYSSLDVLISAGNGSKSVAGTFNYSDGTTQVFTSFTNPDWFANANPAYIIGARATSWRDTPGYGAYNTAAGPGFPDNPRLYEQQLTPNAAKFLTGVTFTSSGFGGTTDTSGFFALSGVAAAPEPSQTAAYGLGILGLAGLVLKARKRRQVA